MQLVWEDGFPSLDFKRGCNARLWVITVSQVRHYLTSSIIHLKFLLPGFQGVQHYLPCTVHQLLSRVILYKKEGQV